jgi:PTH1 family peptidyl-tRNA hydrolase
MILVGLGNIGAEYENTFHNLGFAAVDCFAKRHGVRVDKAECGALTKLLSVGGKRVVLAKPTTYMNLSGSAVKSLRTKYGDEDIVVVFDDFDIPRYGLRARETGSAGTHNGMKNVIAVTGTPDIKRVRIGIGRGESDWAGYVLGKIPAADKEEFSKTIERCVDSLERYAVDGDFVRLMRDLNGGGCT